MNTWFGSCSVILVLWLTIGCDQPKVASVPTTEPPAKQATQETTPSPATTDSMPDDKNQDNKANTKEDGDANEPAAAKTGQLKIQFRYGGDAFEPKKINVTADKTFCGKTDLRNETLLVNPENNGIRNVIVYVYTGRGGTKLAPVPHTPKTVILKNELCRFEPHIVLSRQGDTLRVENPDDVGHNANISFMGRKAVNLMIPPQQHKTVELTNVEPAPIPINCNIHPWMKARIMVLEHPYVGVSDDNGDLTIDGLPTGETLTFRAFHEAGPIKQIILNGTEETWKRSRFEAEIKPGLNDLGIVKLSADALKSP